jgi:hypothetical protein
VSAQQTQNAQATVAAQQTVNAAFTTQTSVAQRTALAADAPLPPRTGDGSQAGSGGFNPAVLAAAAAFALGALGLGLLKLARSR